MFPTHLKIVFEVDFDIMFEIVFEIDYKIVSQPALCLSFQIEFNLGWKSLSLLPPSGDLGISLV